MNTGSIIKNRVGDIKKPSELIMSEFKWKLMLWSVLRGENLMLTGLSGCGKSYSVTCLAKAMGKVLNQDFFIFNMGSTQNPRCALLGNKELKDGETTFVESQFIHAISTPNSIILLDELSRANPEAWNILLPVLETNQRSLLIDENNKNIRVADGVTFIATANIGSQYTATRKMDRSLVDRFIVSEVDPLSESDELALLKMRYPDVRLNILSVIARIASLTRNEYLSESSSLTNYISTRYTLNIASMINDGFTINEALAAIAYPLFDTAGGINSNRSYIKQTVQGYISTADMINTPINDISSDDDSDFSKFISKDEMEILRNRKDAINV